MNHYKLTNNNLKAIQNHLKVPAYDRDQVKTGIVHIGVGGFHRSHQAFYTDQLLHQPDQADWGVCGVFLLPSDKALYEKLKAQDGLYTLIVKEFDGTLTKRVVGSLTELIFAPANPAQVIEKIAHPDIKVVTLTITEGGYNRNDATGAFDAENPLIKHDLQNPHDPKTVFGYLTQALKLRKEKGLGGITIQSCDNIQENGAVTQQMLMAYLALAYPDLSAWVASEVSFPNSMVDRITPATSSVDISALETQNHIIDACPVVCEPYLQWAIEDQFIQGRPPWESVGVQFVEDIAPYEKMKLSLLNAGHSVLGILGALLGYTTIDEAMADKTIRHFMENFMEDEVFPVIGDIAGVNLFDYKASLIQRFGNQYIKDTIVRICAESSAKIPIFILPTTKAQLRLGGTVAYSSFVIAAWARLCLAVNQYNEVFEVKDKMKAILENKAQQAQSDPVRFLEIESVFGDLNADTSFVAHFTDAYHDITNLGLEKCLRAIQTSPQSH